MVTQFTTREMYNPIGDIEHNRVFVKLVTTDGYGRIRLGKF